MTYWCAGYNPIEVFGIALDSFEALPTASTTSKIVGLCVGGFIVFLHNFFAYYNACMKTAIDKIMNYVWVVVKCLEG